MVAIATGVVQHFKGRSWLEHEAIAFLQCSTPKKLYWSDISKDKRRDLEKIFYAAKLIDNNFKPITREDKTAAWQAKIIVKRFCKQ